MTITEVMRLSERIFKMYSPLTGELYQAGEYEYEDSADEYNGEEQPVTVYWDVEEFLYAGNYRIDIFADGTLIGTQDFTLD